MLWHDNSEITHKKQRELNMYITQKIHPDIVVTPSLVLSAGCRIKEKSYRKNAIAAEDLHQSSNMIL